MDLVLRCCISCTQHEPVCDFVDIFVARHKIEARSGSWVDAWVGRFLPVGPSGLEDLRFSAALNYAGVPRVACYHEEGELS